MFFSAGVPPISSTIVNVSSQVPIVTMRILDENMRDAMVTHLGQKLILKIQLSPPNGNYIIHIILYKLYYTHKRLIPDIKTNRKYRIFF